MGKTFERISPELAAWIQAQPLFFVGTAPLSRDGHVNVSPKGLDSLRVLGERRVAYLDLTGSGAETIAHVRENGRIVLMFCAFAGSPKIVRLHGMASVVTDASPDWPQLRPLFPRHPGTRAIIDIRVSRVSDSCGFGIPVFGPPAERDLLLRWAEKKGPEGVEAYQQQRNARSIDGLPAMED